MATTYSSMGLKAWNAGPDLFSYADLDANWAKVDAHDHTSGKGVQIPTAGIANNAITAAQIAAGEIDNSKINVSAAIAGSKLAANSITNDKIATADLQKLGLSDSVIRRGKSIVGTEESRTNTAYGTLTTPDQVSGVVLPTDGLIFVAYQATWKSNGSADANAAIFLNGTQLQTSRSGYIFPVTQSATTNTSRETSLTSAPVGLVSAYTPATAYTGDVTTGQAIGVAGATDFATSSGGFFSSAAGLGGPCIIFAAAGTYTISVQFKATSGTVTAKNRKLWVWTMDF